MNALERLAVFVELSRRPLSLQVALVLIHIKVLREMILSAQIFSEYAQ